MTTGAIPSRRLAALFEREVLRAVAATVVEGRLGTATVDDPDDPTVARLSLGCYEMVGGDASHPLARAWIESVEGPREIVYGNDPAWRRLVQDVHGPRVVDRPMTIFDASRLEPAVLERIESSCPDGYSVVRMDAGLARQLDAELQPHALQVFESAEAFARDGMGFGVVADRDGALACAATAYTVSRELLEVAIATRVAHRGRGLAAVASAALMRAALERGLEPQWSASNPVSKRLAARLGYVPAGECEVLYLA